MPMMIMMNMVQDKSFLRELSQYEQTGNLRVLILFLIYIQILWMNLMNGGKTILVLDSNDQPQEW